jgi:hypothetical protein
MQHKNDLKWAQVFRCALKRRTWNNCFGAKESARDHDAKKGIPFFQREFSDRRHVLQPAIVDEN